MPKKYHCRKRLKLTGGRKMIHIFTIPEKQHKLSHDLNFRPNRLFTFLTLLMLLTDVTLNSAGQGCGPDFKLKDAKEICPPEGACHSASPVGGQGGGMTACKLAPHIYTVYPNIPGYAYTWTITGGTPAAFTGNPVTIVWGTGASGTIKVVISNLASGGNCIDSIRQEICLIDGPQANFILSSDTVCLNTPVLFTNTSLGGSDYLWDFGDGTTSTLANPPGHVYASPGIYTVTLTASNAGGSSAQGDIKRLCGCVDIITKTVVVLSGAGPEISLDCCYGTVCPGDTSAFCSPTVCTNYNWSVTGGTIISGAGTSCIKVKWNATYTGPTTVSLAVPGCSTTTCPGITTLNVPVLYPNLPISGPSPLCVGTSGSYFLPVMPGTYYQWTTTAPAGTYSFHDRNRNTASINISFTVPGTYQILCQYNNPLASCSGNSIFTVNVLPVFSFTGNETVCEGSTTTYFANGLANWSVSPAGAIVPAGSSTSASITWNLTGTYTILACGNRNFLQSECSEGRGGGSKAGSGYHQWSVNSLSREEFHLQYFIEYHRQ
jgi:PKD repeat protein